LYEEQQKRKMLHGIIIRFSVLDTFEHKEEVLGRGNLPTSPMTMVAIVT
jgi:hypothetical protein